ncbi:MAG TPA: hypothetical protein PKJ45_05775 [Rubrivivax sp.]|nr:hypothetical protein [Burkholderiales bacterium]HNU10855.1 hypothetical protein [Rubrivivax sp.]
MFVRPLSSALLSSALLLLAVGLGVWWARDLPAVQRWFPAVLPASLTEGLSSVVPAPASVSSGGTRKCRSGARVLYTDAECPPGTRVEAVSGDRLSVLPAPRAAAAEAPASASAGAQTPLRRLAGPDEGAAQRERMIEQALQR